MTRHQPDLRPKVAADPGIRLPLLLLLRIGMAVLACGAVQGVCPGDGGTIPLAALGEPPSATGPVNIRRFSLPGPLAGVVARVDLTDPRVDVRLVMADGDDPGRSRASADCAGRLEVPSVVARRQGFAVAVNASYFSAKAKDIRGQKVPYFVGNCANPVGWHFSDGRLRSRPTQANIQATLIMRATGKVSMHASLEQLPPDIYWAVGGNALVLEKGRIISRTPGGVRHPRTAIGVSEDGNSLLLVAVDGRQDASRGATLVELGEMLKQFGAHDAINLDGGGSTAMVLRDPTTGVFTVVNHPSELGSEVPELRQERPVVDVLGVVVREPMPLSGAPTTVPQRD
jgi:hypothetical protein